MPGATGSAANGHLALDLSGLRDYLEGRSAALGRRYAPDL